MGEEGSGAMRKIWFIIILFLAYQGSMPYLQAQSEEDFEQTGLKHFDNAYFKAIPQKDKEELGSGHGECLTIKGLCQK